MRWRFWRRERNGEAARAAKADAERRLRQARRDWPEVRETHDRLAEWIDTALRGRA
jgi:hypothetical protein